MKIGKKYGELKKIKIDEGDSLSRMIYIKYKKEETIKTVKT